MEDARDVTARRKRRGASIGLRQRNPRQMKAHRQKERQRREELRVAVQHLAAALPPGVRPERVDQLSTTLAATEYIRQTLLHATPSPSFDGNTTLAPIPASSNSTSDQDSESDAKSDSTAESAAESRSATVAGEEKPSLRSEQERAATLTAGGFDGHRGHPLTTELPSTEHTSLFLTCTTPMAILKLSGCLVVDINEAFERAFGYSRQDVRKGNYCLTHLTHDDDVPALTEAVQRLVKEFVHGDSDSISAHFQKRCRHRSGATIVSSGSFAVSRTSSGEICILSAITSAVPVEGTPPGFRCHVQW